jgi:hypothetical protein
MRVLWLLPFTVCIVACSKSSDASGSIVRSTCLAADIPAETEVHIFGAYEGGDKGGVDEPVYDVVPGKITMTATGEAPPRLYVVTAYEEVAWDFAGVPAERIAGVIAYGYEKQIVNNVPAGVPIAYATLRERSGQFIPPTRPECGGSHFAYKGGPELEALVEQVETATGLKVTKFFGEYAPKTFNLDNPDSNSKTMAGRPRAVVRDRMPGADFMRALVESGVVRLANQSDIDAWNAARTRKLKSGKLAPFVSEQLRLGHAYVVLKDWTIPERMAGAYSRSFIVPASVSTPIDLSGHNNLFIMSDGSCSGASVDCQLLSEEEQRP